MNLPLSMKKNILIYYSPFIEIGPQMIQWPVTHLYPLIARHFIKKGYTVVLVCGDDIVIDRSLYEHVSICLLKHEALLDFCSSSTAFKCNSYYADTAQNADQLEMAKLIKASLGDDFEPEYIFTYLNEVPFLQNMYPNALILRSEVGWSSQTDLYQLSFYFDPCGIIENSAIFRYAELIKNITLSEAEKIAIAEFKSKVTALYAITSPYTSWINQLRQGYKKILILAGTGNYAYFHPYLTTNCSNFLDMIIRVAQHVPHDCALIITLHPSFDEKTITSQTEQYIYERYPNVILRYQDKLIKSNTHLLLSGVDGLIAGESKLFHDCLVMNKPFFYIHKTSYKHFSAGHVSEIKQFFATASGTETLANYSIIYWLLTHYIVCAEDIQNTSLFDSFLQQIKNSRMPMKNFSVEQAINKLLRCDYEANFYKHITNLVNQHIVDENIKMNAENATLKEQNNCLHNENAVLRNEALSLRHYIEELFGSTSWRYTRLLRQVSFYMKNIRLVARKAIKVAE